MPLKFFLYQSRAVIAPADPGHRRILSQSIANNRRSGVTGVLHHENGLFLQYLEGQPDDVAATIARIRADPRHAEFKKLSEGPILRRYFPDFNMGTVDTRGLSVAALLDMPPDKLTFDAINTFDLIVFLAANRDRIRMEPPDAA